MRTEENGQELDMEDMDPGQSQEAQPEQSAEPRPEAMESPAILRRGVLQLKTPIKSRDEDVMEIQYDFDRITGKELLNILDDKTAKERATTQDAFTARQGLKVFARAAAGSGGLDEFDLGERLSAADMLAASQLGKLFFMAMASGVAERIKSL